MTSPSKPRYHLSKAAGDRSIARWDCVFCAGNCEMWILRGGDAAVTHSLPYCVEYQQQNVAVFVHNSLQARVAREQRQRAQA